MEIQICNISEHENIGQYWKISEHQYLNPRLISYSWALLKNGERSKKTIIDIDVKYSILKTCECCGRFSGQKFINYKTVTNFCAYEMCISCTKKLIEIKKLYELIHQIKKEIKHAKHPNKKHPTDRWSIKKISLQHDGRY